MQTSIARRANPEKVVMLSPRLLIAKAASAVELGTSPVIDCRRFERRAVGLPERSASFREFRVPVSRGAQLGSQTTIRPTPPVHAEP